MNELIAKQIKTLEETLVIARDKREKARIKKNTKDFFYWAGVTEGVGVCLERLREIQTQYENTLQSIEEDMKFLRGE